MNIGAISFQPYIYNTNYISGTSLNKVNAISDDLVSTKTDYSGLVEEQSNQNPLRRGETLDFAGILQQQLQMARSSAARVMKPAQEAGEPLQYQPAGSSMMNHMGTATYGSDSNLYLIQRAMEAYSVNLTA